MKYKDYPESWFNCGAFLLPANYSKRPWANAIGTENNAKKILGALVVFRATSISIGVRSQLFIQFNLNTY